MSFVTVRLQFYLFLLLFPYFFFFFWYCFRVYTHYGNVFTQKENLSGPRENNAIRGDNFIPRKIYPRRTTANAETFDAGWEWGRVVRGLVLSVY